MITLDGTELLTGYSVSCTREHHSSSHPSRRGLLLLSPVPAGCHYPVCQQPKHAHMCLRPWSGTNTSKLRMAAPEPLTRDMLSMTDWQFDKMRRMIVAGASLLWDSPLR